MSTLRARGWDALVVALVVFVLLDVLAADQEVPPELSVPVSLAMTVPLLWGRRHPELVAAVVLGAWLVEAYAGDWDLEPQSQLLPVCVVFWSLGAYLPRRRSWWALLAALSALVAHRPDDTIVLAPLMAGVYAAGRLMQSRERLARALQEERVYAERYAVAEERTRIARELHDVVGHSLSVITVQAGAERLALGDARPETSRVLSQIEQTGRETLHEMRRLLGVLRSPEEEADLDPHPGLGQLLALTERLGRSGLDVEVSHEGVGAPLAPGVDISAYRIVQEALTNVLKHADTDRARVVLTHSPEAIEILVSDDGTGGDRVADGRGHGLAGMRERVALFGGSLEAGPVPGRGWRLSARLPREPAT